MSLEAALGAAARLRDALAAEVDRSRAERALLKRLDGAALLERAAERARFLEQAARHEREMAGALAQAAGLLGLPEVTVARLQAAAPGPGARLAGLLSDIRALAGALREIDQLNASLARRALSCVRGYVEALAPVPRAYERGGLRAAGPALATVSSRG
jgi:hypothetical protein